MTSPTPYDLTFTGTSFNVTTDALNVQLGTFSRPNTNNIGNPASTEFNLQVTFTLPLGVNGSPAPFTAILTGHAASPYDIDFDNSLLTFSFSGGSGTGTFQFSVNDVLVANNSSAFLTGSILNATFTAAPTTPAAVPEPGSLLLLASGLTALGLRLRKSARKS